MAVTGSSGSALARSAERGSTADQTSASLASFLRTELADGPERRRAAARIVISCAIAITLIQTLQITQGAWILITIFVLSMPNAGATMLKALDRVTATVIACLVGILLTVVVADIPWLRVPIGALGGGLALFLTRTTTHPYGALLGGITFCMFLLGTSTTPAEVVEFGLARTVLIAMAVGIVLLVDLFLLPSDPESQLVDDLRARLTAIQAALARVLAGRPKATRDAGHGQDPMHASSEAAALDRLAREKAHLRGLVVGLPHQIDLLTMSEARHPSLRERHMEQITVITAVERLLTATIALELALEASGADPGAGPFASRLHAIRAGVTRASSALPRFAHDKPVDSGDAGAGSPMPPPASTPDPVLGEAQVALLPAVLDLESGLALLERTLGLSGKPRTARRLVEILPPSPLDAPPTGWLTPSFSLANLADIRLSLKASLAIFLFYLIMTGMAWPGLETGIVTVLVIANSTNGAILHKATLRLIGASIGGIIAIAVIVGAMPIMTTLASFLVVCCFAMAAAAWVTAGSARISYVGVQMGIAGALCLVNSLGPTTNLAPPRDRVVGVLFSDALTTFVFYSLWPVSARGAMRTNLVASIRAVNDLLLVGAHLDRPAPVAPARGYRWQFYQAVNNTVLMADEAAFEAEGWTPSGAAARVTVRELVPAVQETYIAAVAIIRHRLAVDLASTPASYRDAMHAHTIAESAHLEAIARRLEGKSGGPIPDLRGYLEVARQAAAASRDEIFAAPDGATLLAHVDARVELHGELVDLIEQLEDDTARAASVLATAA